MGAENHPAYPEESARLVQTLGQVQEQLRRLSATTKLTSGEVDYEEESMHAIRAAQEALETMREEAVARLKIAVREPYFGRIDFQERHESEQQVLYIGKVGVEEEATYAPLIIDWRAPVASLFYASTAGSLNAAAYVSPDGVVEGTLWRKRNLEVKLGQLRHIADSAAAGTAAVAQGGDTYLLYRLQESRDHRLRDIVATIQGEQNAIIRADKDRPLIIQGVAGSGKTTVALHRLAYLLYAYRDSLEAERTVIFAPSRMFLDYIADVFPELGVRGIQQTTFQDWALEQLSERIALVEPAGRLEELFSPDTEPAAGRHSPGRYKGSLEFKAVLDEVLARYEAAFVPPVDLVLGPGTRIAAAEVHGWFHEHYSLHPLNARKERIFTRIRTWAASQIESRKLKVAAPERKRAIMAAVRQYMALWPKYTPVSLYKEILSPGPHRSQRRAGFGAPEIPAAVRAEAHSHLKRSLVTSEDLAPLVYLQQRLHGLKESRGIDHVVIDEAQDFSPFQLDLLRRLMQSDSFTILGDVAQGIHTYSGIGNWSELMAVFPPEQVQYHVLQQSYRSTCEVMNFANQVLVTVGMTETLARPVFRSGDPVRLHPAAADHWQHAIVAEVRRLQERHTSLAVVGRTEAEVAALHGALVAAGLDAQRIRANQRHYQGGLSVLASYLTKGLEFDGVIVADASAHNYRLNTRDARLLYVVLTRALHDLTVFYRGQISPLLAGPTGPPPQLP